MRSLKLPLLMTVGLLALHLEAAFAQSPIGHEFEVAASGNHYFVDIDSAAFPDGSFLLGWQQRFFFSETVLVVKRFAASGAPLWEKTLVRKVDDNPYLYGPHLVSSADSFVLLRGWDSPDGGIGGRRYDRAGEPVGPRFSIKSDLATLLSAAALPDGGYVVTFADGDRSTPEIYSTGIFARIMEKADVPRSPVFRVNRSARGDLSSYRSGNVAADASGRILIAWDLDYPPQRDNADVHARFISPEGVRLGAELQVNTYSRTHQRAPSVAASADDVFTVVWWSVGRDDIWGSISQDGYLGGIYGQRYTRDGNPLGEEFRVNSDPLWDDYDPTVAADAQGNFVVVWTRNVGERWCTDVMARLFRRDGTPVGPELSVSADRLHCEGRPTTVAFLPNGTFVTAWSQATADLWAARFAASPGDEPCLWRGSRLLCDTGRTGGDPELEVELEDPAAAANLPDAVLIGDFDGDGREDPCIVQGTRFRCDLDHRGAPFEREISFGTLADTRLLGDLNGDGRADACLRRRNLFLCDTAQNGGSAEVRIAFGQPGDTALLGDLDGDGDDDPCFWRAGVFYCDLRHDGGAAELTIPFGPASGTPLLGDLDGDGDDDPCIFADGKLSCDLRHDGGSAELELTLATEIGDLPLVGNLDGL